MLAFIIQRRRVEINISRAKIIVISGVTAGGKTSLINEINRRVKNCYHLSFDDYSFDALPSAPSL